MADVPLAVRHELWRRGQLSWKLHSGQRPICEAIRKLPPNVKEVLNLIARRWGKSYLGCTMALEDCLRTPGATVAIIAPTIKHAGNIVLPLIREILKDAPKGLIVHSKSQFKYKFKNGSELILGGFDTAVESFRGLKLYNIYLEESGLADQNEYEYIISSVLLPTLLHTNGKIIHLTTLSPIPNHPLHTNTIPLTKMNGSFFSYNIYSNPLLTEDDIADLCKAMGGENSAAWKRECLNILSRDESILCIPEWDEKLFVREYPFPEKYFTWIGGDTGGVRDMSVLLWFFYDFRNNHVHVFDGLGYPNTTPSKQICSEALEQEKKWQSPEYRMVDASGQTLVDFNETYEYSVMLPDKTDLDASINLIRFELGNGRLSIAPRCKLLIATLESQSFNKNRTDMERTKTLGHGDALMALVYGLRHTCKKNPYPRLYKLHPQKHFIDFENHNIDQSSEELSRAFS